MTTAPTNNQLTDAQALAMYLREIATEIRLERQRKTAQLVDKYLPEFINTFNSRNTAAKGRQHDQF